jgi:hypothetical protein
LKLTLEAERRVVDRRNGRGIADASTYEKHQHNHLLIRVIYPPFCHPVPVVTATLSASESFATAALALVQAAVHSGERPTVSVIRQTVPYAKDSQDTLGKPVAVGPEVLDVEVELVDDELVVVLDDELVMVDDELVVVDDGELVVVDDLVVVVADPGRHWKTGYSTFRNVTVQMCIPASNLSSLISATVSGSIIDTYSRWRKCRHQSRTW